MYAEALSFFCRDLSDEHNIGLELDSGSVLGGVKFDGFIPWDFDGDVFLLHADISTFNKKVKGDNRVFPTKRLNPDRIY